jgi:kynurenine 3-monooxygenase
MINEQLLAAAEREPNVKVHFEERCDRVDLSATSASFTNARTRATTQVNAKFICGADGAFSQVREAITHTPRFDYSQKYLDHSYKELTIPPTPAGDYALKDFQALHIWPRGDFMLIALPNKDKSFTCTLFMPTGEYERITTDADVRAFFERYFRDALPLMPTLIDDWHRNPESALIMVACSPFHYRNAFLIGDACHAMVPFYGQGMNASLQDVEVFCDLLDAAGGDLAATLPKYTAVRKPDADAVCRLRWVDSSFLF